MARRFILWDIDGTLVTTGAVGRFALEEGARRASGLSEVPEVAMGGKTDPQILSEMLVAAGLAAGEIGQVLPAALEEAEHVLLAEADRMRSGGTVHPGVRELLDALARTGEVRQTLLTGNIAPNAELKVAAFGLESYFDFAVGAYGDDHHDRDCLVPISLERVRELRGEQYSADEVWVIGDTARDLSCAKAAGVRCLVVGTGRDGFDAVRHLEADAVVENLADTEGVLAVLFDGAPVPGRGEG